jgi:hypothetical protein
MTTIAGEIKTLIDGMTVLGGYYYDWSNINEPDSALKTTWPSAVIRYNKETAADGTIPSLYGFQNCEITIEVEGKISPSTTVKPEFTADGYFDNALSDLISVLSLTNNTGYMPLSGEAVISFVSSEKIKSKRGDTYHPSKLITTWNVFYHNH